MGQTHFSFLSRYISIYNNIFCIFSPIIFLIWIETDFDEFLITQIVLISFGNEPKGDWGWWWRQRAGGPWLESRQFLEIELTVTAGIIITPGENRVWGFPMTLSKKKIQPDCQILFCSEFGTLDWTGWSNDPGLWLFFVFNWHCWTVIINRIFVIVISFFFTIHI